MFILPVFRRLALVCGVVIILIAAGTYGYAKLEGWSFDDGFFMTVITFSTVGYGETNQLSPSGRIFTAGLIFLCIVTTTCWTAALTSFIVENDLSGQFDRRRMARMIEKLQQHTIVCGSGKMAHAIIERLAPKRIPMVLVDDDMEQVAAIKKRFRRLLVLEGSPTCELTLAKANIMRAKHVIAATESEMDNLLIAITCRDIGKDLTVFARSNDASISNRMRKAGVDEVVSPFQLCGDKVAELILA